MFNDRPPFRACLTPARPPSSPAFMTAAAPPLASATARSSGASPAPPRDAARASLTAAMVDRTLGDLTAWRRSRATERDARRRASAAPAPAETVDEQLAALETQLASVTTTLSSDDATASSRVVARPNKPRPRDAPSRAPAAAATATSSSSSSAARRPGPVPTRATLGPAIGAGVFGARLADGADDVSPRSPARRGDAAREGGAFFDREDAAPPALAALSSWTADLDAVLSKMDACDEVGRAKGAFFREQDERRGREKGARTRETGRDGGERRRARAESSRGSLLERER